MQIKIAEDWDKEERLKKAGKSSGFILKYDDEDDTLDKECVASSSKAGSVSIEAALDMVEQAIDDFYDRVKESASHGWTKSLEEIVRDVKAEFEYFEIGPTKSVEPTIEFVSYTGKYPYLCAGALTLKIDGETVTFGGHHGKYRRFWMSGGNADAPAPWIIDKNYLPPKYQKYADEIATVFNANVEYGCCGTCL